MKKNWTFWMVALALLIFASGIFIGLNCECRGGALAQYYYDKAYLPALLVQIDSARASIDVELYNINNFPQTIAALKAASQRGVCVRILADNQGANDPDNKNGTGLPENILEKAGICVRWEDSSRIMHRKLCIIDQSVICCGSHNWTRNGFENNAEISNIFFDSALATELLKEYEIDWAQAQEEYGIQK